MSEEIKLGWYKSKKDVVSLFDPVEVVYSQNQQVVHTTKNCGLKVEDSTHFARYRDYIGPERGEWVSPDSVTIAEIRKGVKARFRNHASETWRDSHLLGFSYHAYRPRFESVSGTYFDFCEVWRPKQ